MTEAKSRANRTMPKGGRKGGAIFPRITLSDAIIYAKKLVSKTHISPQSKDILYSGVFGAKGSRGAIKMSAMKQYGFLEGEQKIGYIAGGLAKKIDAAPPEEILPLYQEAVLRPNIFKAIFDTYHGDTISRAKLKQRAADLNVHPDETEKCVDIYIESLQFAKLVEADGDLIRHQTNKSLSNGSDTSSSKEISEEPSLEEADTTENSRSSASPNNSGNPVEMGETVKPRAVFNVNVTLDSSLDIEKLSKQLELLKRFGAI